MCVCVCVAKLLIDGVQIHSHACEVLFCVQKGVFSLFSFALYGDRVLSGTNKAMNDNHHPILSNRTMLTVCA